MLIVLIVLIFSVGAGSSQAVSNGGSSSPGSGSSSSWSLPPPEQLQVLVDSYCDSNEIVLGNADGDDVVPLIITVLWEQQIDGESSRECMHMCIGIVCKFQKYACV